MSADLRITNGVHIATVRGALDGTRGTALVSEIKASVERGGSVVLDCAGMDRMDVEGLRQLLALKRWADKDNGKLVIAAMAPDAWEVVTTNGCDSMFEVKPSVPAALQALGVNAAPEPAAFDPTAPAPSYDDYYKAPEPQRQPDPYTAPPAAVPAYEVPTYEQSSPLTQVYEDPYQSYKPQDTTENIWVSPTLDSAPTVPATPVRDSWSEGNDVDRAWEQFEKQSSPAARGRSVADPNAVSFWKKPLFLIGTLLILVVAGGLIWFLTRPKPMELTLETPELVVEEGKTPKTDVRIVLKHGESLETGSLPEGLELSDISDSDSSEQKVYTIGGTLKPGLGDRILKVAIAGVREGESTPAETLVVKTLRRKLAVDWNVPISLPPMQEGEPVVGYSRIATGATKVEAVGLPDGLRIEQMTSQAGAWQLVGTPSQAGSFTLTSVTGTSETGDVSSYPGPITVTVAARPAPVAPVNPVADVPPPPPPPPPVDDAMREILLVRIDGMAGKFDDSEIRRLREMVNRLQAARRLGRVEEFAPGQATVSPSLEQDVSSMLKSAAYSELLKHPDCYIVVVGYASRTGGKILNDRISRDRARALNVIVKSALGREADLCGAYGATTIHGESLAANQSAEIFAGILQLNPAEKELADRFRDRFNQ